MESSQMKKWQTELSGRREGKDEAKVAREFLICKGLLEK